MPKKSKKEKERERSISPKLYMMLDAALGCERVTAQFREHLHVLENSAGLGMLDLLLQVKQYSKCGSHAERLALARKILADFFTDVAAPTYVASEYRDLLFVEAEEASPDLFHRLNLEIQNTLEDDFAVFRDIVAEQSLSRLSEEGKKGAASNSNK